MLYIGQTNSQKIPVIVKRRIGLDFPCIDQCLFVCQGCYRECCCELQPCALNEDEFKVEGIIVNSRNMEFNALWEDFSPLSIEGKVES